MKRWLGTLTILLAGCSLTATGPTELTVAVTSPEGTTHEASGNSRQIALRQPFADERPDPAVCGHQKKRIGFTLAVIVCSQPPAAQLASLFGKELEAAGFRRIAPTEAPGLSTLQIEGRLTQFFVEPVRGPKENEADLEVVLTARSRSGLEATRRFYVKGKAGDPQRAVNDATRKLLQAMVAATEDLLDRYPPLGVVPTPRPDEGHVP